MKEILIIKMQNGEKLRNFLNEEKVNYEIFAEENNDKKDNLLQEYKTLGDGNKRRKWIKN